MNSRVYPSYKTKCRVANWASYDRALVGRGDVTLWVSPDAIATWAPTGVGTRGGQRQYSDVAIETALTLRLLFHLPLRQTEGFLQSLFGMMGLELAAPDHTTLSRRGQHLDLTRARIPTGKGLHLIVDSTGLSIVGEGEWARAKHGIRGTRGWKKLHLGVDRSGVIIAHALTEATVDDATTAIELIKRRQHHGGRGLRHDRRLQCGGRAWRDRRGGTGQNRKGISTEAAVERSRSHDSEGARRRMATVEEGIWLPSTGPCGERLLPLQVDHRGEPSRAQSGRAGN
jgi:IS5 family transposase